MSLTWVDISRIFKTFVSGTAKTAAVMTIKINEPGSNLVVTNGDRRIRIIWDFVDGDIVKIDFQKRTIHINNNLRMTSLDIRQSDFFKLNPGENQLAVIPHTAEVEVTYPERWL